MPSSSVMTTETATPGDTDAADAADAAEGATSIPNGSSRLKLIHGWIAHPFVRSPDQLTLGERSADRLRNGMGSWPFVFIALGFLAVWMVYGGIIGKSAFDPYPFILLNLV